VSEPEITFQDAPQVAGAKKKAPPSKGVGARRDAEIVESVRELRASAAEALPTSGEEEPPALAVGVSDRERNDQRRITELVCQAWMRRGGAPAQLVQDARTLVVTLRKNRLID